MNSTTWLYVAISLFFIAFTIMSGSGWGFVLTFAALQLAHIEQGLYYEF